MARSGSAPAVSEDEDVPLSLLPLLPTKRGLTSWIQYFCTTTLSVPKSSKRSGVKTSLESQMQSLAEEVSCRNEKISKLEATTKNLELQMKECQRELKQLLAVSSDPIQEARRATDDKLAEKENELEQLSQEAEGKLLHATEQLGQEKSERKALEKEMENLRERYSHTSFLLEQERKERVEAENDLKIRMGQEHRELIQEAEATMEKLRAENADLKEGLSHPEKVAREANEVLQDKLEYLQKSSTKLQKEKNDLNAELTRLSNQQIACENGKDAALKFIAKTLLQQNKKHWT